MMADSYSNNCPYYVSFDVELDGLIVEGQNDFNDISFPKITCAAIYCSKDESIKLYYSVTNNILDIYEAAEILDELWKHSMRGAYILTWGGTAVDFRALYNSLIFDKIRKQQCLTIARFYHIDITIASFTDMGIMMSLDAAARGTLQGSKILGISFLAPIIWKYGNKLEVLEHVKSDAILTYKVYNNMMLSSPPKLTWETKSGRKKNWSCSIITENRLLSTHLENNKDHQSTSVRCIRLPSVGECFSRIPPKVPFDIPAGMNRDTAAEWLLNACLLMEFENMLEQLS